MSLEQFIPDPGIVSSLQSIKVPLGIDIITDVDTYLSKGSTDTSYGIAKESGTSPSSSSSSSSSYSILLFGGQGSTLLFSSQRLSSSLSSSTTPLSSLVTTTEEAYTAAKDTLFLINELDNHHQQISSRTTALHREFQRIIQHEQKLSLIINRVYKPLSYFESLYIIGKRLGVQFTPNEVTDLHTLLREMQRLDSNNNNVNSAENSPVTVSNPHKIRPNDLPLNPTDVEFPLALERIDECITYLASHTHYKDSTKWLQQFKELQNKALLLIKQYMTEMVEKVVDGAQQEINKAVEYNNKQSNGTMNLSQDGLPVSSPVSMEAIEMAQLQLRFRTELTSLRKLIAMVELRANRRNGAAMLTECYRAFLDKRIELISTVFRSKLTRIAADRTKDLRKLQSKNGTGNPNSLASVDNNNNNSSSSGGSLVNNMSGGASVYTTYTTGTVGTRVTTLWSEDVTSRESCVVDTARTCAALMARASQAEHQLFHNLFTTSYTTSGISSSSSSSSPSLSSNVADTYEGDEGTVHPGYTPASQRTVQKLPSSGSSILSTNTKQTFGTMRTKAQTISSTLNSVPSHVRTCADTALNEMQEEFCGLFADVLRPYILSVNSLDVLCDIVRVLRDEVLSELVYPRGSVLQSFARVVSTLIKDIQERIVFRAAGFITERIENYKISGTVQTVNIDLPFRMKTNKVDNNNDNNNHAEVIGKRWNIHGDNDFLGRLLGYYMRLRGYSIYTQRQRKENNYNTINDNGPVTDDQSTIEALGIPNTKGTVQDPVIPPSLYDSWSPIIECTLALFTRLYQMVEPEAFDNLAQDAVTACTTALQRQANAITNSAVVFSGSERTDQYFLSRLTKVTDITEQKEGTEISASNYQWSVGLASSALRIHSLPSSTPSQAAAITSRIDGQLYLIKNLLILREQLSPFEMQLSTTTRSLDFSSTSDAFSTLIGSLSHVFTLSRNNALLSFVATSLPTVQEQKIDGRIQLEQLLKTNCELFINISMEILLNMIPQTLETYLSSSNPTTGKGTDSTSVIPLNTLESLLVTQFSVNNFTNNLYLLRRRLGLYLGSAITASILFRPIKDRLTTFIKKVIQNIQLHSPLVSSTTTVEREGETSTTTSSGTVTNDDINGGSSSTGKESIILQQLYKLLRIIETSETIITDPTNDEYGYDFQVGKDQD